MRRVIKLSILTVTILKIHMPVFYVRGADIVSVPAKIEDYYRYDKIKKRWVWSEKDVKPSRE
jgi:hypothetical protein